jgi:hypothetical protein
MSRSRSLRSFRFRAWGLAAAAAACTAMAMSFACIVAPPPSPPKLEPCRPIIDTTSVQPPAGILTDWPTGHFTVPVEAQSCDPTDGFDYRVFVDFPSQPNQAVTGVRTAYPLGGGPSLVQFDLMQPNDLGCHVIEFVAAHAFNPTAPHLSDSIGESTVTWLYSRSGGINGCPSYDAGDGSFPPDGAADSLPFTPEGGQE